MNQFNPAGPPFCPHHTSALVTDVFFLKKREEPQRQPSWALGDKVSHEREVLLIYPPAWRERVGSAWAGEAAALGGMGMLLRAVVLTRSLFFCNALLDLTGLGEVKGVWKDAATLPCAYSPVQDFVQHTVAWTVVHDQSSSTVVRRDGSGDHVFLAKYRDRASILKGAPGNVSLRITDLEISDRGAYTCQVTWRASNNSLVAKEITTRLEVDKVAVTKPIIRAAEPGLAVPAGANTSLTCVASGSPPISYRWFRRVPGGKALLLSSQAELAWDNLQPSDAGKYYCEAENRAGARAVQTSDEVELRVTDLPTTVASARDVGASGANLASTEGKQTELLFGGVSATSWTPWGPTTTTAPLIADVTPTGAVGYPAKNYTAQDVQRTRLSLYQVILLAGACAAVVFLVIFLIICIRKPKESQVYNVKSCKSRAAAASQCEAVGHYEEPITSTENNYVMEPLGTRRSEEKSAGRHGHKCVGNTQESEYEVGDAV